MTITPRSMSIEDVMGEVVDPTVTEVEEPAHVDDPIFWEVVTDMGFPELSHDITVNITVYSPKKEQ